MTAEEFLQDSLEISHFYNDKYETMCCYSDEVQKAMKEFAKYHAIEIIKKLSKTEAEYQYNIKYVFPEYNIR